MSDIDDPFTPSDATIIRPRPGAGRRGSGSSDSGPIPVRVPPPSDPLPPTQLRPIVDGLNPLVQAASPVLLLAGRLRSSLSGPDIALLRRHAVEEIRRFEESARAAGVPGEVVQPARYALCSTMDEAVLSTPWGSQSEWGQQSLLVAFHREAWGGERFFERLDQLKQDPARHIDLLELHYLCLAVGFMGRYQVLQRGDARLAEVQQGLYRTIRTVRGAPADELSMQWRGLEDRRHRLVRYVPWWVVGAGVLAALSIAFVVFRTQLGTVAAPVYTALLAGGREQYQGPAPPAVVSGPRLKELLPSDAALSVVEEGGRTRIILAAPDLFASGSPTPNSAYLEMLSRVGAALERVPGQILVEGHTDDQPLRSLTYANNFELSRARAANVVRVLQRSMSQPARLESSGVGSERPRHTPESLPENRARNRRVEIIHVQGV